MDSLGKVALVFALVVVGIFAVIMGVANVKLDELFETPKTFSSNNSLAIKDKAKVSFEELPINPPVNLKTGKEQFYGFRKLMANSHSELLSMPYTPEDALFGNVHDGHSWWGMLGKYYYGPGGHCLDGPAEQSRFIGNPFLLAAPDFVGFSIDKRLKWKKEVTPEKAAAADFPLACEPQHLEWFAQDGRVEVTYDVTNYLDRLNRYAELPVSATHDGEFNVVAYNAHDLGMKYVGAIASGTQNVQLISPSAKGAIITASLLQSTHYDWSCGVPGGCNAFTKPEFTFQLLALPAKLELHFWPNKPTSSEEAPGLSYIINFR
jgi:hypothetical protein